MPRDIVTTETCNRCHDPIGMHASHGGPWVEVEWCTQCHNETTDMWSEDLRFEVMIHKIHAAQEFDGFDFSEVHYPADLKDCEVCHTGGTPTADLPMAASPNPVVVCDQSGRGSTTISWGSDIGPFEIMYESPEGASKLFTRRGGVDAGSVDIDGWLRGGSTFEMVDMDTGETIQKIGVSTSVLGCVGNEPGLAYGAAATQHTKWMTNPNRRACGSCHSDINWVTGEGHSASNLPQDSDDLCAICHFPDSGGEYDMTVAAAHQVDYKSNQVPGILIDIKSVTNTNPGDNPTVTFSMGTKNGPLAPSDLMFFRLIIAGPNTDFDFLAEEFAAGATKSGNDWVYTFGTPLPSDATGSFTAGAEAFTMVPLDVGGGETRMFRMTAENDVFPFAVTDATPMPRRVVVTDQKCEACHSNLQLHGTIRHEPQYCATCHLPASTDVEELRPGNEENGIAFKYMVHKIHRGADLEKGYVAAGHNQSIHDYSNIHYPGDLRNCDACHVGDSQLLPLPAGLLDTATPQEWWDPMGPAAAACVGCHDGDSASVHIYTNTTFFGESCSTCHGEGKSAAVEKLHAR